MRLSVLMILSLLPATACVRSTEADRAAARADASEVPTDGVSDDLPVLGTLTDFHLTERAGSAVNAASLKGQVTLMNFMFTSCTGPCPMMAGHVKALQAYFKDRPGVHFVSVTTDPATDTTAVLSQYADRFDADARRWLFLTGDKAEITRLARDVLKLPAGEDPGMHTTRFALIDAAGQVRAYPDSTDASFQDGVRRDIERLLGGAKASH
jgi:protein SCO1/2